LEFDWGARGFALVHGANLRFGTFPHSYSNARRSATLVAAPPRCALALNSGWIVTGKTGRRRAGKTVTGVKNFLGLPEKEQLAKVMQKACGTGGTVKDGQIEIQGDKRAEAARILTEANFRQVFAGG
jgi:translation initiation factor 1